MWSFGRLSRQVIMQGLLPDLRAHAEGGESVDVESRAGGFLLKDP